MFDSNLWKRISTLTIPLGHQLKRLSNIRRKENSLFLPALIFLGHWLLLQLLLFPILLRDHDLANARAFTTIIANATTLAALFTWLWISRPHRLSVAGIRFKGLGYDLSVGLQIGLLFSIFMGVGLKVSTDFCLFVGNPSTMEAWLFTHSSFLGLTIRLLLAVLLAPLFEELLFRGLLYTAFRRLRGPFFATVITAALFAIVHLHPIYSPQFLLIFTLGLIWAHMREKCRSIFPALFSHSLINLTIVIGSWCEGYYLQQISWTDMTGLCVLGTVFYLAIALFDSLTETTLALIGRTSGALLLLGLCTILLLAQSRSPLLEQLPSFALIKSLSLTTKGDYEAAEQLLVDQLALHPDEARLWFRLAAIKYDQGKYEEALSVSQALADQDSALARALDKNLNALCLAEMGKELDEALALARQSLALTDVGTPFYLAALDTLGWVHYHRQEYEQAYHFVHQAKEQVGWLRSPQVSVLDYHLAMIALARGHKEKGRRLLAAVVTARHGHKPSIRRSRIAMAKMGFSIATPSPRS